MDRSSRQSGRASAQNRGADGCGQRLERASRITCRERTLDRSDESLLLLHCARSQMRGDDGHLIGQLCAKDLDWDWIVRVAVHNRVAPLLYYNIREAGLGKEVPSHAMRALENAYYHGLARSTRGGQIAGEMLPCLRQEGVEAILLRGLALAETLYDDPALRPFSDFDLLIRRQDLDRAKATLLDLGYHYSPSDIDARYFERNHLHLQFVKVNAVIELHWALDHKYTVFAIDYDAFFSEARDGELGGASALLIPPENLLLSLCIHLVKHCYYMRHIPPGPELITWILNDGFLILVSDIDGLLRRHEKDLDWDIVLQEARRWLVEPVLQPSLALVVQLFRAPVPERVLESLPAPRAGWVERKVFNLIVHRGQAGQPNSDSPRSGGDLLSARADLIFRPVRALDLLQYLRPTAPFIARRYDVSNGVQICLYSAIHLCRALGEMLVNVADMVYFCWMKRRRY